MESGWVGKANREGGERGSEMCRRGEMERGGDCYVSVDRWDPYL